MPLCIYKTRFEKTGYKNAETPDFSGFRVSVSILVTQYGRSVIIGFQKTQIYQWFAGSRQEVFILIHRQPRFDKCARCKFAVEFYSGMGYTVSERS